MRKLVLIQLLIAVAVLLSFLSCFKLLQKPSIYYSSLAKISHNYEREGTVKRYKITAVKKPYVEITENNLSHWDASLYKSIRDSTYSSSDTHSKERLAFYPLFPFMWRLLQMNSTIMVFFNYALIVVALILLFNLLEANPLNNLSMFGAALLLPSAATFFLPYAESLFVFTMAIAVLGLFRQKYWLYFIGMLGMSMTRPAVLIFMVALLLTDINYLIRHRNEKFFWKELMLKMLPLITGFLSVVLIQYYYSGSWLAYWNSLDYWPKERGFFNTIKDWSIEGFGMNVFTIIFLAIPALIYSMIWGIKSFSLSNIQTPPSLFSGDRNWIKEYLFNSSMLFIAGNFFYLVLTSGNVINGFYRYVMCTPCFYILLFMLPDRLSKISLSNKAFFILFCLFALYFFLDNVIYGDGRFRFMYLGMYLSVLFAFYLLYSQHLSKIIRIGLLLIIALPSILWHTYLFNMFLSNGWIFT
jgi:hypothetical protein